MSERWKDVVSYEGLYRVSTEGRVWSTKTGRFLRPAPTRRGYLTLALHRGGRGRTHYLHRLVLTAFAGPPPKGYEGNHKNAVKADCRLANLEWLTPAANRAHAQRLGLYERGARRGERHGWAKLTEEPVREIRRLSAGGHSPRQLARRFPVTAAAIWCIVHRRAWRHVA